MTVMKRRARVRRNPDRKHVDEGTGWGSEASVTSVMAQLVDKVRTAHEKHAASSRRGRTQRVLSGGRVGERGFRESLRSRTDK